MVPDKAAGGSGSPSLLQGNGQAAERFQLLRRRLIQIEIRAGGEGKAPADAVQPGIDQQGEGDVGIGRGIRRA